MSRPLALIAVLLAVVLPARAQQGMPEVSALFGGVTGYAPVALGGEGFGLGRPATVADAGTANPAALANLDAVAVPARPAVGLALGTAGAVDLYNGVRVGPGKALLPSAAVVVPVGPWRVGLAFTRLFAQSLRFPAHEITTVEQPEGTGEFFRPTVASYLATLGPVVARELRFGRHALALGARAAWVHGRFETEFWDLEGSGSHDGLAWAGGAVYTLYHPQGRPLASAGAVYEHDIRATGTVGYTLEERTENLLTVPDQDLVTELPARLTFDASVSPLPTLTARAAVAFVDWSGVSDTYRDRLERSLSLVWRALPALSVSAGYYDAARDVFGFDRVGAVDRSERYVTAGAVVRTGPWRLDVGLADSHLFSSVRTFERTLARAALTRVL